MAISINRNTADTQQVRLLRGALALILFSLTISGVLVLLSIDFSDSAPYFFLVPWLFGLALVFATPFVILYRREEFSFANPIIFATWSYFFPAFVIGGLMLALGYSQPFFLDYIQDPEHNLPYSIVLIALGYLGLAGGYFLPLGERAGKFFETRLPLAEFPIRNYAVPGIVLLGLGMLSYVSAFILGVAGYQLDEQINSYDGLVVATTQFWMQAIFILAFFIFKKGRWDVQSYLIAGIVMLTFLVRALYAGNRSSFVHLFMLLLLAYILAGREFKFPQMVRAGVILVFCLVAGMIYGTTFRNVKGGETAVGAGQYTRTIFDTFDQVGRNDGLELIQTASATLAERIDSLSSLAVVVSNYEQLEPYEEQYGLENNILNDLTTFFIPRIIWTDKPVSSDARRYGELYYNYGENSFAMTAVGDLLRNFGPIGVPIGMFVLGILLRIIYRTLIESQSATIWRAAIYFILLTTVNYESFYGLIIPNIVKFGIIAIVGVLIVTLLIRSLPVSMSMNSRGQGDMPALAS